MSDNLTPRERAENALKAAGFKGRHIPGLIAGLYDSRWTRESDPEAGTDVVRISSSLTRPGEKAFELHLHGEIEHLPAYLNAKALLEACEEALALLDDTERTVGVAFPETQKQLRAAVSAAKGGTPPCNPSASSAPPDPEASP